MYFFARAIILIVALSPFALGPLPAMGQAPTSATPIDASTKQMLACASREGDMTTLLEPIIREAYGKHLERQDVSSAVAVAWANNNGDSILRDRFRVLGTAMSEESSWDDRVNSMLELLKDDKPLINGFSERLVHAVITSAEAKELFSRIAEGIDTSIGMAFEAAWKQASTTVSAAQGEGSEDARRAFRELRDCIELHLGAQYGDGFAKFASKDLSSFSFAPPSRLGATSRKIDSWRPDFKTIAGLSGIAIVAFRRVIVRRVLSGAVGRLLGSVAARIAAAAIPLVGWAMAGWMAYEYRQGIFPTIVEGMQDAGSLQAIRESVKDPLVNEIKATSLPRSKAQAAAIREAWIQYKQDHAATLEMTKHKGFASLLSDVLAEVEMKKITATVGVAALEGGEASVLRELQSGRLREAVLKLPEAGLLIGRKTKSLANSMEWLDIAGKHLPRVAALGLFEFMNVKAETPASIESLMAFDADALVRRMARQPHDVRAYFASLDKTGAATALTLLKDQEINALAGYLGHLSPEAKADFDSQLVKSFGALRSALTPSARAVVLASPDQRAALASVVHDGRGVFGALADLQGLASGRISLLLLWHKYWVLTVALLLVALFSLGNMILLLRGRRTVVVIKPDSGGSSR